jgi:hypothetical protein
MIDWTEFAPDGHSTIVISMVTRHGRAASLAWKTVRTSKLKNRRAGYEDGVDIHHGRSCGDGQGVTGLQLRREGFEASREKSSS